MSDKPVKANIFAAGAVLWRKAPQDPSAIEIAVVHRPKYDDWSFPKGKLDPGETFLTAAVREVREETSITGRFGRHLGWRDVPDPGTSQTQTGSNTGRPKQWTEISGRIAKWMFSIGFRSPRSPIIFPTRWIE